MSTLSILRPSVRKGHDLIKRTPYCRPVCKHVGVICTQHWILKVWNPVHTGSWGTGVMTIYKRLRSFCLTNSTSSSAVWSWWLLTKETALHTKMLSCQAAAHGSSFKPAGPGCGESGITAVQHQQKKKKKNSAHTHTPSFPVSQRGNPFSHRTAC